MPIDKRRRYGYILHVYDSFCAIEAETILLKGPQKSMRFTRFGRLDTVTFA